MYKVECVWFELQAERRRARERGTRIANDTLFAFDFDRRREVADDAALARLREAVAELEAAPPHEAMRLNETLGRRAPSQALQKRRFSKMGSDDDASSAAGESAAGDDEASWAPWRPGTRTHARLMDIAQGKEAQYQGADAGMPYVIEVASGRASRR